MSDMTKRLRELGLGLGLDDDEQLFQLLLMLAEDITPEQCRRCGELIRFKVGHVVPETFARDPQTWGRKLKDGLEAAAFAYDPPDDSGLPFGWNIQQANQMIICGNEAATLKDAIKTALAKAAELQLIVPEDDLCYKCGLEAEINDGDDASGPPVCCDCYTSEGTRP